MGKIEDMDNFIELHKKAGEGTERFIAGIGENQWNEVSNCAPWSVRDLVNHIVYENVWVPEILVGKTVQEVGSRFDGDLLGDNPLEAYKESFTAAQEALEQLTSLDMVVHLSYGDTPARSYMEERVMDLAVHGWDVAKSTGQKDELNKELVEFLYAIWSSPARKSEVDELRGGMFGEEPSVSEGADEQTKMLAILGRKRF